MERHSVENTAWAVVSQRRTFQVVFAAFRRFEADDMTGFGAFLDPGIVATAPPVGRSLVRGSGRMR